MSLQVREDPNNLWGMPVYEDTSNGGALLVTVNNGNRWAVPIRYVPRGTGGAVPINYAGAGFIPPPPIFSILAVVVSADGVTVIIYFSEDVTVGVDDSDGFTLVMSGGNITLPAGSIVGNSIEFTATRTITEDETGTANYVQPGDGIKALDNDELLGSASGIFVTNNSTQSAGTFQYLRPGGVDTYLRPGGVSTYLRP